MDVDARYKSIAVYPNGGVDISVEKLSITFDVIFFIHISNYLNLFFRDFNARVRVYAFLWKRLFSKRLSSERLYDFNRFCSEEKNKDGKIGCFENPAQI